MAGAMRAHMHMATNCKEPGLGLQLVPEQPTRPNCTDLDCIFPDKLGTVWFEF